MKKIYLQLMALICLFLFGGVNAWATVYTWTGNNQSPSFYKLATSKTKAVQIGHTGHQGYDETSSPGSPTTVYFYDETPGSHYSSKVQGISVAYSSQNKYGYLFTKNSGGGIVTLYLQAYIDNSYPNTWVTIKEKETGTTIAAFSPEGANSVQGDGTAVSFRMEYDKEYQIAMPRHYTAIYIKKVEFYTPDEVLTLDEGVANATNKSSVSNTNSHVISTIRTLRGGKWNTFCLPMNISQGQLEGTFKNSKVFEMTGYNSANKTISFEAKTTYTACTPCLIMPEEDVVNPYITDPGNGRVITLNNTNLTQGDDLKFVGVLGYEDIFTTGNEDATKFYMNNDCYLVYPTSDSDKKGTIKGLRAYFECDGVSSLAKGMTFAFNDTQTGIKTVEFDVLDNDGRVYSIDGRYVGNSTNNLTRGIYIQNGRKFVVK